MPDQDQVNLAVIIKLNHAHSKQHCGGFPDQIRVERAGGWESFCRAEQVGKNDSGLQFRCFPAEKGKENTARGVAEAVGVSL